MNILMVSIRATWPWLHMGYNTCGGLNEKLFNTVQQTNLKLEKSQCYVSSHTQSLTISATEAGHTQPCNLVPEFTSLVAIALGGSDHC